MFDASGSRDKQLGVLRRRSAMERAPIMNAPSVRLRALMECKIDFIIAQRSKTALTKYQEMKSLYTEGEAKDGEKRTDCDISDVPGSRSSIGVRQALSGRIGNLKRWRQGNIVKGNASRREERDKVEWQQKDSMNRSHGPLKTHKPGSLKLKGGHYFLNEGSDKGRKDGSNSGKALHCNKGGISHIKEGLDDTIENLMLPAILRTFVPTTMSLQTCPEEAFKRYCETPPSLIKEEHERQAVKAAKRYASNLRYEGYTHIRQLVPLSRRAALLHRLGFSKVIVS